MTPRAKRSSGPRALDQLGDVIKIGLIEIVGLDPCNARRVEPAEAEIASLAADIEARGLLNPLIVRGGPGRYAVLAGGRRWRALRRLARPNANALVRVFEGSDEDAAAESLAENIARDDLHPLDEADRVAEMAQHARPEAVARTLARTPRWVRERVALSALPDAARAAWFAGDIGLAQARALTLGSAAAIEALLARPDARAVLSDARAIRAALLPKGVSSRAPSALFVGLDAYVAAGGAVHEDLFSDEAWCLDVDLLRKLERRKLTAEADRLCEAEGWGTVFYDAGDAVRCVTPDYTAAEIGEIERLETSADPQDLARVAEIGRLGMLRKIAQDQRARYGVYVGLDTEGRLDVVRGVVTSRIVDGGAAPPATPVDAAASDLSPEAANPYPTGQRPPHPEARAPFGGLRRTSKDEAAAPVLHADARRVALLAASRGCAEIISKGFVGDALRLALAAMLCRSRTPLGLNRLQGPGGHAGKLARKLAGLDFAHALAVLAQAQDSEVDEAFVETVACAVDCRRAEDEANHELIGFLDRLEDGAATAEIARQFDYANYFFSAGRPFGLAAIRDCGGAAAESERAWMKDEALAKEAALLARAKRWIPDFLRSET